MNLSTKLLGAIGLAAAPFLFLQFYVCQLDGVNNTSLGGLFDLIYMLGWMCSIIGLLRLQATGARRSAIVLLYVQLAILCVANVWNVWVIINPSANSTLFFILDMFWPLSNVCLLIVGIVTAVAGRLQGWRRYAPLVAGLWLPVAMGSMVLFGRTTSSFYIGGVFSIVAWAVMALSIFTATDKARKDGLSLAV